MLRICNSLLFAVLLATPMAAQSLDSLLARMTLEEKLGQLNLLSANGRASPQQIQLARDGKLGGLFNVIGAENSGAVQRVEVTESRLKIRDLPNPARRGGLVRSRRRGGDGARGRPGSRSVRHQLDLRADGGHRARSALGTDR